MLKNRFFSLLMVGSLAGLAACAEEEPLEEPFEDSAEVPEAVIVPTPPAGTVADPAMTDPMMNDPMMNDPAMQDGMMMDTMMQ